MAVRSSATAEDLPGASFAGLHETYLNVRGWPSLEHAIRACMASLFTDRAIVYRAERDIAHEDVALSVGVQKMVRSDLASAGVIFTLDTESGSRDVVLVTGAWGLGEIVVQGRVNPDEWWVHKATLRQGFRPIVRRRIGDKALRLVYDEGGGRGLRELPGRERDRRRPVLERRRSASARALVARHRGALRPARRSAPRRWTSSGPRTARAGCSTWCRRGPRPCTRSARRRTSSCTRCAARASCCCAGEPSAAASARGPCASCAAPATCTTSRPARCSWRR